MAFEEDFVTHLRARAGITTYTRHRIYPVGQVPQGTRDWYIVYQIDSRPLTTSGGYGDATEADVTLHCFAASYKDVVDLYRAVFDAIHGFRGTMGSSTFVSGCYVRDFVDVTLPPKSGQEYSIPRRSMSVTVWHKETSPSLT